ncbi:MAG TPA: hypothetical protein VGN32_13790 [Ktedonobacterales bacterium]|nr:hypothetical protein [Ktedonobacterales bacterium]
MSTVGRIVTVALAVAAILVMFPAIATPRRAFACPTGVTLAAGSAHATAPACANAAWSYGHSWYITNISDGAMAALADVDAEWADTACSHSPATSDYLTILNFGRPAEKSGQYGLFSIFVGGFMPYTQVATLTEQYVREWYGRVSNCPRLHLAIGTGNDYQCYDSDAACSVLIAGEQFNALAQSVRHYVATQGYDWQVTIWAADDIEGGWDQWACNPSDCTGPQTRDFLMGFAAQERQQITSNHLVLLDYGDAAWGSQTIQEQEGQSGPMWTQQNMYDAAWGLGWDVPLPETYWRGQTARWQSIYIAQPGVTAYAGAMHFFGNMSECPQADALDLTTCYQPSDVAPAQCEQGPGLGYDNLTGDVGAGNLNPNSYSTNIYYQGHAHASNDPCQGVTQSRY